MTSNTQESKILVVDDDVLCRDFLCEILRELGKDVVVAQNAEEAFRMVCDGDIRIVISDWKMPGMDGIELCQKIRNRQLGDYVYFILLTSLSGRENLVRGLEAGADDFLSKPCDPNELQVRLRVAERVVSLEKKGLIVFSLAKLAESRDPETGTHLERIREYSRIIAQTLAKHEKYAKEIDADFIRAIFLTSPLHDIGKVGIPDHILLKPGRLTPEEFEVMKQHVTIGSSTLDAAFAACPSAEYLRFARDIANSHHEKFDGSGYPHGLSGEDIPLCGRIVALADVYDALTTKRVYKEAYSHEEAREIIIDASGQHFDPAIVAAFLEQEEKFKNLRGRLDEELAANVGLPLATSFPAALHSHCH